MKASRRPWRSCVRPCLFVASADRDLVADTTTATASLVAEWVLYSGNSRRLAIEAARETVLAARQGLVAVEQQVLQDAVTAYLNVWRDLQVVNVREANVRVVTPAAARRARPVRRWARTPAPMSHRPRRASLRRVRHWPPRAVSSKSAGSFSRWRWGAIRGALAGLGQIPGLPRSEAEADGLARQNAPSILRLQHEVTAAELAVQGARASYRPTITLDGRARPNTFEAPFPGGEGEGGSIGLTLTQPIYRGGQLASLERQALAQLGAVRASLNQQTLVNVQIMGNEWAQMRIANAQIQAADQQISAAELAFEGCAGGSIAGRAHHARRARCRAGRSRRADQPDRGAGQPLFGGLRDPCRGRSSDRREAGPRMFPGYDPAAYSDLVSGAPARVRSVQGDRLDRIMERVGRD